MKYANTLGCHWSMPMKATIEILLKCSICGKEKTSENTFVMLCDKTNPELSVINWAKEKIQTSLEFKNCFHNCAIDITRRTFGEFKFAGVKIYSIIKE